MTDAELDFKGEVDKMLLAARVIADLNLAGIVDTVSRAHTLGPFVDPTRYRDALHRGDMDRVGRLAAALIEPARLFRDEIAPTIPGGVR